MANYLNLKTSPAVLGIGHAILDRIAFVDEVVLNELRLTKGTMSLIAKEKLTELEEKIRELQFVESSGGSAANSIALMARRGVNCYFVGSVSKDSYGRVYKSSMEQEGVITSLRTLEGSMHKSGSCHVFVTPDGERTMVTHLGAASELGIHSLRNIDFSLIDYVLLEGYLFDSPSARELIIWLLNKSRSSGVKFVLSLSDTGVIERNSDMVFKLVSSGMVDIIYSNEGEFAKVSEFVELTEYVNLIVVTLGYKGAVAITKSGRLYCETNAIQPIDTTGAGDAFLAGSLTSLIYGNDIYEALESGNETAKEVINKVGAR